MFANWFTEIVVLREVPHILSAEICLVELTQVFLSYTGCFDTVLYTYTIFNTYSKPTAPSMMW